MKDWHKMELTCERCYHRIAPEHPDAVDPEVRDYYDSLPTMPDKHYYMDVCVQNLRVLAGHWKGRAVAVLQDVVDGLSTQEIHDRHKQRGVDAEKNQLFIIERHHPYPEDVKQS